MMSTSHAPVRAGASRASAWTCRRLAPLLAALLTAGGAGACGSRQPQPPQGAAQPPRGEAQPPRGEAQPGAPVKQGMPGGGVPGHLDLRATALAHGSVRVIVNLKVPFQPEGELSPTAAAAQRRRIAEAQQRVLGRLAGRNLSDVHRFEAIPAMSMSVDAEALKILSADPDVSSVQGDRLSHPNARGGGVLFFPN